MITVRAARALQVLRNNVLATNATMVIAVVAIVIPAPKEMALRAVMEMPAP